MLRVMFAEWYSPSCPRGVGRRGAPRTAVASCPRPVCLQQYEDEPVTSPGVPHPSPPPTTRTRACRSSRWGLLRYRLGRLYPPPSFCCPDTEGTLARRSSTTYHNT